jgi:hypothetical protein
LTFEENNRARFELTVGDLIFSKVMVHYSPKKDTFYIDFWTCSDNNYLIFNPKTDTSFVLPSSVKAISYCSTEVEVNQNTSLDAETGKTMNYQGKTLYYVFSLKDSLDVMQGDVYAEKVPHEDTIYKRIYIFNRDSVVYFIGDGILTNNIETKKTAVPYYGYRFTGNDNHFFEFAIIDDHGLEISDTWRIQYNMKDQRFEAPYDDF